MILICWMGLLWLWRRLNKRIVSVKSRLYFWEICERNRLVGGSRWEWGFRLLLRRCKSAIGSKDSSGFYTLKESAWIRVCFVLWFIWKLLEFWWADTWFLHSFCKITCCLSMSLGIRYQIMSFINVLSSKNEVINIWIVSMLNTRRLLMFSLNYSNRCIL